jgi:hypothetical protein
MRKSKCEYTGERRLGRHQTKIMRARSFIRTAALWALAAAAITSTPALAYSDHLPPGSYLDSCRVTEFRRGQLSAYCRNTQGGRDYTSIFVPSHNRTPIANCDGALVIGECRWPNAGSRPRPPHGSYTYSCTDIDYHRNLLTAMCRDGRGRRVPSRLYVSERERRPVTNCHGTLTLGSCVY